VLNLICMDIWLAEMYVQLAGICMTYALLKFIDICLAEIYGHICF